MKRKARANVAIPQAVIAAVAAMAIISAAFWAGAGYEMKVTGNAIIIPVSSPDGTVLAPMNANYTAYYAVTYNQWTDCSQGDMSIYDLEAYCKCKGYGKPYKCWFIDGVDSYDFLNSIAPACGKNGASKTFGWHAVAAIACQSVVCGNGVAETSSLTNELCDGTDLRGKGCSDVGNYTEGTLACNSTCDGYIKTGCTYTPPPTIVCGNGKVETGETCDGTNFSGKSCLTLGYTSGTLICGADCKINTSQCTIGATTECGNGILETSEECDGTKFGGLSCLTEGFMDGALSCTENCTIDNSACTNTECGNGIIEEGEECDTTKLGGQTCKNIDAGFTGGTLSCFDDCTLDTGACTEEAAVTAADALASINDAQTAITAAQQAKKNITEAVVKFNSAVAAYNAGEYPQSQAQALAAKLAATIAPELSAGVAIDFMSVIIIIAIVGAVALAFYLIKVKHLKFSVSTAKTQTTPSSEAQPAAKPSTHGKTSNPSK